MLMVDFLSLNFVNIFEQRYQGIQYTISKVLRASTAQSEILSILVLDNRPNASWTAQFNGPAIRRNNVSDELRQAIEEQVTDSD